MTPIHSHKISNHHANHPDPFSQDIKAVWKSPQSILTRCQIGLAITLIHSNKISNWPHSDIQFHLNFYNYKIQLP